MYGSQKLIKVLLQIYQLYNICSILFKIYIVFNNQPVTKLVIPEIQKDIVKVIIDYGIASKEAKNQIDTGNFKLIYN